jgi:uncharacterized protein (DUF4415 family)
MTESKRAFGSNLARLDATTDEEIARHMVEDGSPEWTDEDFANAEVWHGNKFLGHGRDFKNGRRVGRPKGTGTREMVTLRLDKAVLAHFRAGGPGWQTRLNDALRALVDAAGPTSRAGPEMRGLKGKEIAVLLKAGEGVKEDLVRGAGRKRGRLATLGDVIVQYAAKPRDDRKGRRGSK